MRFVLSIDAEEELDRLEQGDPSSFELVLTDLQLLEALGAVSAEVGLIVGQWVWISGPSGRVSYWVAPVGDDNWLIESIQVH